MAKFALILGGADLDKRSGNSELAPVMLARYMKWMAGLRASGSYVDSQKLRDQSGTRLSLRAGQVIEGPFIETKEAIGGIFIVEAPSLEDATALARDCPVLDLQNGYVDVRVIDEVRPGLR